MQDQLFILGKSSDPCHYFTYGKAKIEHVLSHVSEHHALRPNVGEAGKFQNCGGFRKKCGRDAAFVRSRGSKCAALP